MQLIHLHYKLVQHVIGTMMQSACKYKRRRNSSLQGGARGQALHSATSD